MKTLKDIMNESGMNPAHSHSKHDSDHDMVDVSDDNVVRRLNSILGCIADMDHMLPEQTIGVVRRRLASIGLSFPNVDIVEDSGSISAPLTQFAEDLVKILILLTMSLLTMIFHIGLKVVVPLILFMKKKMKI